MGLVNQIIASAEQLEVSKAFIFLTIFLIVIPVGSILASAKPVLRNVAFILMLYFTCWAWMYHIAPIPVWTGTARGFALSMVDIFSSILLLSMIIDSRSRVTLLPLGFWTYLLYFFFILLSGIHAKYPIIWGFEVVKMCWMYIFFLAAYNFIINYKSLWLIVYTVIGILIFLLVIAMWQKYIAHTGFQVSSTMPHQNSLALYVSLFGSFLLGIFLNEKISSKQAFWLTAGLFSSSLLIIFTYSRGGILAYAIGLSIVIGVTVVLRGFTSRGIFVLLLMFVGGLFIVSYAMPNLIRRFYGAPDISRITRERLAKAAIRIADVHFLGVGANHFSIYSGPFYEYAAEIHEQRRNVDEDSTWPLGGIVETIYLLVAAECGWLGMVSLLIFFFYYLSRVFLELFYLRHCECFGVAAGIFGGLCSNYIHSLAEWSLKQYGNFYQLMFVFALIAAIWVSRKNIGARQR